MDITSWNVRIVENLQATMIAFSGLSFSKVLQITPVTGIKFNLSDILTCAQKEWDLGNFAEPVRLIKRPPYDEKPHKERWSNEEVHRIYEVIFIMVKNLSSSALHLLCTIFGGRDSYAKRGDLLHAKKALFSRRGICVFYPIQKTEKEREVPLQIKQSRFSIFYVRV